jgi:glycosyltransferase involved in cell wall biosynthesis
VLTIPCFDEEKRLDARHIDALLEDPRIDVLLVDDGSRDGTLAMLRAIAAARPTRVRVHAMPQNGGKAEAVRTGLRASIDAGAAIVGYVDADFATPAVEVRRLLDELERTGAEVALGSRVARLGAEVKRSAQRHYLGRLFATSAALVLGLRVYDTQCGAKVFRVGPALIAALDQPFSSRWAFDVELLGRLTSPSPAGPGLTERQLLEVPLRQWHDVGGSKLGGRAMVRAGTDVLRLGARVARVGRRGFFPDGTGD